MGFYLEYMGDAAAATELAVKVDDEELDDVDPEEADEALDPTES